MTLTAQRSPNGAISISLDLKTGRFEVAVEEVPPLRQRQEVLREEEEKVRDLTVPFSF